MKPFLLPITLIAFTTLCLSIVHMDNMNKLNAKSEKQIEKQQTEFADDKNIDNKKYIVSSVK